MNKYKPCTLTIVIPCYNEERTLRNCVETVLKAFEPERDIQLQIVIVNDCSRDNSLLIARQLAQEHPQITVVNHDVNQGKGAALRSGFSNATGDFVAIQDADLEYDPTDLIRLLGPLRSGVADVVYGSRFLSHGVHRVLYFWHSMGNRFLTFLSNMFTDLNLTDMETCYKVFKRDVIQSIDLKENRFGFEPEVTAKLAEMRVRIYEMGVSYFGRTYEEGKKIGARDGFRALYCIVKYNASSAPMGLQFLLYSLIGGVAAVLNLMIFLLFVSLQSPVWLAAFVAFILAATANYLLCVTFLFRQGVRWKLGTELLVYSLLVGVLCVIDLVLTSWLFSIGFSAIMSKALASCFGLVLNFLGRRAIVFPDRQRGDWNVQNR